MVDGERLRPGFGALRTLLKSRTTKVGVIRRGLLHSVNPEVM